tara:strand:+ start:112 stop:408 length:297 start_codon:yes stop_codon:yes gene_type:complete
MLFRIIFSLIYLVTLEISIASSFQHNEDINICSQDKEPKKSLKCDLHCISNGLIDNKWLTTGKNYFDNISELNIQLLISNINFDLEIFPRTNSPPLFS